MSESEKLLWKYLRNEKIGFKFRRQHPIGIYALDFYCPKLKLCIEVDGEQHLDRVTQDKRRDDFLLELGIKTIRIPSLELWGENYSNVHDWVSRVMIICEARAAEIGNV